MASIQVQSTNEDDEDLLVMSSFIFLCNAQSATSPPVPRNLVHTAPFTGAQIVKDLLTGHYRVSFDACRLMPETFKILCRIFREGGMLKDTDNVAVEEQMYIFLKTLAHGETNRSLQAQLQHSGETISRYVKTVTNVMFKWGCDRIRHIDDLSVTPRHILESGGGKYFPFFKDCIGALDGTHVDAVVPIPEQPAYRSGRDPKHCTQNVLGVCDFNMRFVFVSAGWEGSAHDSKVLNHAIAWPQNNFPTHTDKYYVVDAGYSNREGFLAPYRNTRYHIPEYQVRGPRGKKEMFNHLHSSLRNIIERSFGVLKKRWSVLSDMPPFPMQQQVQMVICAIALHNFIIEQRINDDLLRSSVSETQYCNFSSSSQYDLEEGLTEDQVMNVRRDAICDMIVASRGM